MPTYTGTTGDDTLTGNSENDYLYGDLGSDVLEGGAGDDSMEGGAGDDTYVFSDATEFNLGDDTISDSGGTDTFDFSNISQGINIDLSDNAFSLGEDDANNSLLRFEGADGSTTITDEFGHTWTAFGDAEIDTTDPWKTGEQHLDLDGSTDFIKTTDISPTGDNWTIHWKQRFDATGFSTLISGATLYSFHVSYSRFGSQKLELNMSSNGASLDLANELTGTTVLSTGQWYDLELSYSETDGYTLYLDGEEELTVASTTKMYNSGGMLLGAWYTGAYSTNGAIADFYFNNEEVLHTEEFTPSTDPYTVFRSNAEWGTGEIENVIGTDYNDTIAGDNNNNLLEGGSGDDVYIFGSGFGEDTISDGNGSNTLDVSSYTADLTVDISGTSFSTPGGSDTVSWSSDNISNVISGSGDDDIIGNTGANYIEGGSGDDSLEGGTGNDTYGFGDDFGNDTISDTSGTDLLDFSQLSEAVDIDLSDNELQFIGTDDNQSLLRFEGADGSTTITDEFGHTWTAFGDAEIDTTDPWKAGEQHLDLDGSADYIKTTDISPTGDEWTIHWRQRFDTTSFSTAISGLSLYSFHVSYSRGGSQKLEISMSSNGASLDLASELTGTTTLTTGQWYDLELTYSTSDGYTLYLDGQEEITISSTTKMYSSGGLIVGSWYTGDYSTNGAVADFYFTNEEMLHSSNFTPSTDPYEVSTDSIEWGSGEIEGVIGTDFDDVLVGNSAGNYIEGGLGDNLMEGGSGNDSYVSTGGSDTIDDTSGTDQLTLTGTLSDYTFEGVDTDTDSNIDQLKITNNSSGGIVYINNYFADNAATIGGSSEGSGLIENILIGNDTVPFKGFEGIVGTSGDDSIDGTAGSDTINGLAGNDTINGLAGNDVLYGGEDNDTYIFGNGSGSDTIDDDLGSNTLDVSSYTADLTINLSGTSFSEGGDSITWGAGDISNAIGGSGNDTYTGNGDDNTYGFNEGWGTDTITGDSGGTNTIDFSNTTTNLSINLSAFAPSGHGATDGVNILTWSGAGNIIDNANGGYGADTITGYNSSNIIRGGDGNDVLNGGTGTFSDSLYGDAGNDSIIENISSGDDYYNGGDGTDTVDYSSSSTSGTLDIASGEMDLNAFLDTLISIENVLGSSFDSNDVIDASSNTSFVNIDYSLGTVTGGDSGDYTFSNFEEFIGSNFDDLVTGSSSAEKVETKDGDDIINLGTGNDTARGGLGDDTYEFEGSFGADIIDDTFGVSSGYSSDDIADFGSYIKNNASFYAYDGSDGDLYLDYLLIDFGSGNTVTIENYFDNTDTVVVSGGNGEIETLVFDDGSMDYTDVVNAL